MASDTTDLRFFVTLAESGTLTEAARRMDVTASAISQRLQQLEKRLNVHLIHRSTRRFSLTDEGEMFYAKAVSLLAELDALIESLRARSGEVGGTLHVWAPLSFGRQYLAPALADFHALHPRLQVSLTLSDLRPAADSERFDLILNIGALPDSNMVAYPIASNKRFLCASPAYLASRGQPRQPEDLTGHCCIVLRENEEDVSLWRLRQGDAEAAVRVTAGLNSNDGEVTRAWALAGKGIILRSEWAVAENLRTGQLVTVLGDWTIADADIVALIPKSHAVSARVRLFLAFLKERFQPVPPWRQLQA
jgi:DNA-binding transcriptional LysR family regulator